jgi:NADH-ubiquinone oxidoreductase chain 5
MYILIIFLPLIGSLIAGLGGQFIGSAGAAIVSCTLILLTFILSILAFYEVGLGWTKVSFELFPWISSGTVDIEWAFLFDTLTVSILVVVTGVSTLVHFYSVEYMAGDPHKQRFMSYLSRFTFFMLILVTGSNLLQLFLGWEGVGLCSYLLINFWFTRIQANKAAIKAILVNRVGDVGLALGLIAIYAEFHSLDYGVVLSIANLSEGLNIVFCGYSIHSLDLIGVLLFVGAVGKSAQLGLHTWLPDAMEGPTPVSALIHAATIVTAGVFLRARISPRLEHAPTSLAIITVFGAITAFFAASTGLLQNDMKRVIAYSTCSQLGYMVFACGVSAYSVGVFHLANHACFKALLFLSAGAVIHAIGDEQDMRRIGGLSKVLPISFAIIAIGSTALIGFPFLTGYYSKDVVLEIAFAQYGNTGLFAYFWGSMAAGLTAFYSIRLLHRVFLAKPSGHRSIYEGSHDAPFKMALPIIILAVGSIWIGWLMKDLFIGVGTTFWDQSVYSSPSTIKIDEGEWLPHTVKLFPVFISICGISFAIYLYTYQTSFLVAIKVSNEGRLLYTFLNRKWFWDKVYTEFVSQPTLTVAYHGTYKVVDRGMLEMFGPFGASNLALSMSDSRDTQTGVISKYLQSMLYALVAAIVIETFVIWMIVI